MRLLTIIVVPWFMAWLFISAMPGLAMADQLPCSGAATPSPSVPLAAIRLPPDLPAGSSVLVTRMTVPPGDDLAFVNTPGTAYIVLSGVMEVQVSRRSGMHVEYADPCGRVSGPDGIPLLPGSDADGWMRVGAGMSVVVEETVIPRIRNVGFTPLELLLVTARVPVIDPETGQPYDIYGMNRDKEAQRQKRRTREARATPVP